MNIYEQFLEYVKNKTYSKDEYTEYHHEPPHYTGNSSDDSPLNVMASLNDHILLHQYRWVVYGEKGDYLMFKGRQKDIADFRRVMNERRIEITRSRGHGFWDPKLQSELGKRGGSKGGSANTEAQYKARQKVGLANKRTLGIIQDFPTSRANISNWMLWEHEVTGVHLIPPQPSVSTLQKILTDLGDRVVTRTVSSVILGRKQKSYGWSLKFIYMTIPSRS